MAGDEGADPVIAAEVGVELEFRTGTVDPGDLSDCIRRAHALGASFLRTMPSGRYHYNDPARQSHAITMAIAGLRAVVPLLDELDMTLGVENHADVTSPELIAIIEAVDSARVRVLLDLGNSIQIFENPRYTIEQLAPYTVALYVKDLVIGQRHGVDFCHMPVALGEGIIDFDHTMDQLMKHCPDARFCIEGVHPLLDDSEQNLKSEAEMLEKSVAFARRLLVQYGCA